MRTIKFRAWDREKGRMSYIKQRDYAWLGETVMVQTERYELMQFTGLLDKNGKEIYEGDVLDMESEKYKNYYVVEFKYGEFRLYSLNTRKNEGSEYSISLPVYAKTSPIIGNIYENPELINA